MRRRRLILLAAACAVLAGGVIWCVTRGREPSYNGRTLSEWLEDYRDTHPGNIGYEGRAAAVTRAASREDIEAIQHIGTNALPCLVRWTCCDPLWKRAFWTIGVRPRGIWRSMDRKNRDRTYLAYLGFSVLGSKAAPAIPVLLHALEDTSATPDALETVAGMVCSMGERALQPVLAYVTNTNHANRWLIIGAVGNNMYYLRTNSALVAPTFVRLLNDRDGLTRLYATNTLRFIAPEALKKAEAGAR